MLHPPVKKEIKNILNEKFVFPDDIIKIIKKDNAARVNYNKFSHAYKRIRVAYIDSVRDRPDEF